MMSDEHNKTTSEPPLTAAEMLEILRGLQPRIPDYTQLTPAQMSAMRRAASLDPEWINHAAAMVDASDELQTLTGGTFAQFQEELTDIDRWNEVVTQFQAMLSGTVASTLVRRHRVGLKLLQAYGISRQMIRQPEHHHLRPYVDKLIRLSKMGRRKKKEEEGAEE